MNDVILGRKSRLALPPGALLALLLNAVWINVSEVFRYFAFVMPMMREALPEVPGVASMNLLIFARWGVWDTLLLFAATGFSWMFLRRFGSTISNACIAGVLIWASIFVIFWLGLYNMSLANSKVIGIALPLALLEMIVASLITLWAMRRSKNS